jgi:hypothetical protein
MTVTRESVKPLLASIAFMAAGLFTRWVGGPAILVWLMTVFGALGLAAVLYQTLKPMSTAGSPSAGGDVRVVLRDGRDYRLSVTDTGFALIPKTSGELRQMLWSEVTLVVILAIDDFPVGSISFIIHGSASAPIEVPWDAEGNRPFLAAMQEKLSGFDNDAVIEASAMRHGVTQAWPPVQADSTHR